MKIIIRVGKWLLNIIYFIFKLKRTKDKVTIISRQSDKETIDISLLSRQFSSMTNSPEVLILTKTIGVGLRGKLSYLFHIIFEQMPAIATSKIVLIDGYCIPISILNHKEELIVIQMWHAMGALKKFGYSILGNDEGSSVQIATLMNMHKGYDYIFASGENCVKYLSEAYNAKEDKFVIMPLPRLDLVKDENLIKVTSQKITQTYKFSSSKKNILYSPTFRKDNINLDYVFELIECIDYEKYNLFVVPHPLMPKNIKIQKATIVYDFSSIEMLSVCDYVITDYSAFVFEAAAACKPIFLYTPDIGEYSLKRGFYIDIKKEEFCKISDNPFEIKTAIEQNEYDFNKIKLFASKYIKEQQNNTEKIINFINKKRG